MQEPSNSKKSPDEGNGNREMNGNRPVTTITVPPQQPQPPTGATPQSGERAESAGLTLELLKGFTEANRGQGETTNVAIVGIDRWLKSLSQKYDPIAEVEVVDTPPPGAGMGSQQPTQQYVESQQPQPQQQQQQQPTQQVSETPMPLPPQGYDANGDSQARRRTQGQPVAAVPQAVVQQRVTVPPTAAGAVASAVDLAAEEEANRLKKRAITDLVASPNAANTTSLRGCQKASTAALHMASVGLAPDTKDALRPFSSQAVVAAKERREQERTVSPATTQQGRISASKKRRQRRVVRKLSSVGIGSTCSGDCYQSILQLTRELESAVNDAVIKSLTLTPYLMQARYEALKTVCSLAKDALRSAGVNDRLCFYVFGSVHLRTVLPHGDNDITLVLEGQPPAAAATREGKSIKSTNNKDTTAPPSCKPSPTEILQIIERYIKSVPSISTAVTVDKLVPADVQVLKLDSKNYQVDLSVNQMGGAATSSFLHEVDARIGCDHLFKSTLLLLKAWCSYEAHILGSDNGYLGTYALSVMLMAVFNGLPDSAVRQGIPSPRASAECQKASPVDDNNGEEPEVLVKLTPIKMFLMFLDYYSTFDFDAYAVTIHGPVSIEDLQKANVENAKAAVSFGKSNGIGSLNQSRLVTELNKANGSSIIGRTVGQCFSNNSILATSSSPTPTPPSAPASPPPPSLPPGSNANGESPNVTPRLTPRGLMRTPNDGDDCMNIAEPSTPYTSPCLTKDAIQQMVAAAGSVDESIRPAQKAYYIYNSMASNTAGGGFAGSGIGAPGVMMSESTMDPVSSPIYYNNNGLPPQNGEPTLMINYFRIRLINIRDPLRPYSNLTRGITRNHLARIQGSFKRGAKSLRTFISQVAAGKSSGAAPQTSAVAEHLNNLGKISCSELIHSMFGTTIHSAVEATRADKGNMPDEDSNGYKCQSCSAPSIFCHDANDNVRHLIAYDALEGWPSHLQGGGQIAPQQQQQQQLPAQHQHHSQHGTSQVPNLMQQQQQPSFPPHNLPLQQHIPAHHQQGQGQGQGQGGGPQRGGMPPHQNQQQGQHPHNMPPPQMGHHRGQQQGNNVNNNNLNNNNMSGPAPTQSSGGRGNQQQQQHNQQQRHAGGNQQHFASPNNNVSLMPMPHHQQGGGGVGYGGGPNPSQQQQHLMNPYNNNNNNMGPPNRYNNNTNQAPISGDVGVGSSAPTPPHALSDSLGVHPNAVNMASVSTNPAQQQQQGAPYVNPHHHHQQQGVGQQPPRPTGVVGAPPPQGYHQNTFSGRAGNANNNYNANSNNNNNEADNGYYNENIAAYAPNTNNNNSNKPYPSSGNANTAGGYGDQHPYAYQQQQQQQPPMRGRGGRGGRGGGGHYQHQQHQGAGYYDQPQQPQPSADSQHQHNNAAQPSNVSNVSPSGVPPPPPPQHSPAAHPPAPPQAALPKKKKSGDHAKN